MTTPRIVSHAEWLEARKAHLSKEKEFTRARDELARQCALAIGPRAFAEERASASEARACTSCSVRLPFTVRARRSKRRCPRARHA